MLKKEDIKPCYPGFTRRAVTFTIDDGNIPMDEKLLSIVRPAGILGTFNLCSHSMNRGAELCRELYRGYGIANHTAYHPYAFADGVEYEIVNEPLADQPPSDTRLYPIEGRDGFYMKHFAHGWREVADTPTYLRCIDECHARITEVFGEGSVEGFVWPYHEQDNAAIKAYIHSRYSSARKTGETRDTTGFAPPADRMAWSYNATDRTLLEVMELYENYPDDGELKFFAFGVHSLDFERFGTWGDLATFAERYGNRPSDYWYATVGTIFEYLDASSSLKVDTDAGTVTNPSALTVYVEYNGSFYTIPSGTRLKL